MKKYILLSLVFLFVFIAIKAKHNVIDAQLISEVNSIQPGKEFWVALKLTAQPGWHTYWRNPGDSGLPTTIEWELPEGFKHSEIRWPLPHIFNVEGITNFGYDKEELLLIKITPPKNLDTGKPVILKAKASWLACRVECVPEGKEVSLSLQVKNQKPEINKDAKKLIEQTINKLPGKNTNIKISAELKNNSVIISGEGFFNKFKKIKFFPYKAGYYNHSAGQKLIQEENRFTLQVPLDDFKIGIPGNVNGILCFENDSSNPPKIIEINTKLNK